MFWQKLDILIPDFYLYSIKIQTDINKKMSLNNLRGKITNFKNDFFEIFCDWDGPNPAQKKIGPRSTQNEVGPEPTQKRTYF